MTPTLQNILKEFDERYPISYNKPFPHFVETPIASHIRQFIERSLLKYRDQIVEEVEEMVERKTIHYSHRPYKDGTFLEVSHHGPNRGGCNERCKMTGEPLNNDFNSGLNSVINLLKK